MNNSCRILNKRVKINQMKKKKKIWGFAILQLVSFVRPWGYCPSENYQPFDKAITVFF